MQSLYTKSIKTLKSTRNTNLRDYLYGDNQKPRPLQKGWGFFMIKHTLLITIAISIAYPGLGGGNLRGSDQISPPAITAGHTSGQGVPVAGAAWYN